MISNQMTIKIMTLMTMHLKMRTLQRMIRAKKKNLRKIKKRM